MSGTTLKKADREWRKQEKRLARLAKRKTPKQLRKKGR
jgi:hypothetical protein